MANPSANVATTLFSATRVVGRKVTFLYKHLPDGVNAINLVQSMVDADPKAKEPFYVLDLGTVVHLFDSWSCRLPGILPFYAVKCNPEPALLGALAALGAGFDSASRAEIEVVLALGVTPDRIIYANPCKPESHVEFAAVSGIDLTTFDSAHELDKIRRHGNYSLLLRLKPPYEVGALCPLGTKYGALPDEVFPLLCAARSASLNIIGVSFHVGSGATDFNTYRVAIALARAVFDVADALGGPRMHILDIGGGFSAGPQFDEAAKVIKSSIDAFFSDRDDLRVIAEPGRFFAETAFTLATSVIGKRVRGEVREYWINDGIFGSMSSMMKDGVKVMMVPLDGEGEGGTSYPSTVFGPTCDAMDTVLTGVQLPDLAVGEWLVFPNMGAYAASTGSKFNGFDTSAISVHLVYSQTH